jgi:hypothetical protein
MAAAFPFAKVSGSRDRGAHIVAAADDHGGLPGESRI